MLEMIKRLEAKLAAPNGGGGSGGGGGDGHVSPAVLIPYLKRLADFGEIDSFDTGMVHPHPSSSPLLSFPPHCLLLVFLSSSLVPLFILSSSSPLFHLCILVFENDNSSLLLFSSRPPLLFLFPFSSPPLLLLLTAIFVLE